MDQQYAMCVCQTWQEPRRTAPKLTAVIIEMGTSANFKAKISYVPATTAALVFGLVAASGAKTETKSWIVRLLIKTSVGAGLDTEKRMGFSKLHLW